MRRLAFAAAAAALALASPAWADWTPRQTSIIKAANQVVSEASWAYMNSCKAANGKARYAAGLERLKAMTPALEKALGEYAVYEIFVLRAPVHGPKAHPPKRCKPMKAYPADREAIMQRYERTLDELDAALKAP